MKRLALIAIIASMLGCGSSHSPHVEKPEPLPTLKVHAAPVQDVSHALGDEVVGTLRARSVTAVSASIMGTVKAVKVKLGSHVKAGQVLVQLTAGEVEAKADQARARLAQAKINLERAQQLMASKSIPTSQFDAAQAEYNFAQASMAEADVMRGYTSLKAPISGVITSKQCAVGDLALPGRPLLVLESPGALRLEASVPEAVAHSLKIGTKMKVSVDAIDRDLQAEVAELSPSADPQSRTVLVKLDLPADEQLRAGMFGRLTVPTSEVSSVVIPANAIMKRGQMETAFVVEDGKARLRLVRTGRTSEGGTEILAGLSAGETVITDHVAQLVDGQPLELEP